MKMRLPVALLACALPLLSCKRSAPPTATVVLPVDPAFLHVVQNRGSAGKPIGYVNGKGELAIPFAFDVGNDFHEGLAGVCADSECRYIDEHGATVFAAPHGAPRPFHRGRAAVGISDADHVDHFGYVDRAGKMVIPVAYSAATDFDDEGVAVVATGEDWALIDTSGKTVLALDRKALAGAGSLTVESYTEGVACYRVTGGDVQKMGCVDRTGATVVANGAFGFVDVFSDGLAAVQNDKFGYINHAGKLVLPAVYTFAGAFSDGLAGVCTAMGTCGWIDKAGKMVIPPGIAHHPFAFHGGLASYCRQEKDGNWVSGFVDRSGRKVLPEAFSTAIACNGSSGRIVDYGRRFEGGLLTTDDGLVDSTGHVVWKAL